MALLTSQQLNQYYEKYKNIDVTFTKEVIRAIGLLTKQVFIKCLGYQWPCIIYSSSMSEAKVLANMTPDNFDRIRNANNVVSLRFAFCEADKPDPFTFFVTAKITGFNPYNPDKPNLNFISLLYTQRPPDDLIGILGNLLDVNVNSKKRKEERIIITADSLRKMGLKTKSTKLLVQGIPRNGIIRDLSFSGAKVVIPGIAKFLVDKECSLVLLSTDNKIITIKGKIVRFEAVEGRKDIAAVAMQFNEDMVPMEYKIMINDYLRLQKSTQPASKAPPETPA